MLSLREEGVDRGVVLTLNGNLRFDVRLVGVDESTFTGGELGEVPDASGTVFLALSDLLDEPSGKLGGNFLRPAGDTGEAKLLLGAEDVRLRVEDEGEFNPLVGDVTDGVNECLRVRGICVSLRSHEV